MLKKVREKVSDDKIAAAIGMSSLKPELDKKLAEKLSSVRRGRTFKSCRPD
jgi:hypothetical protein